MVVVSPDYKQCYVFYTTEKVTDPCKMPFSLLPPPFILVIQVNIFVNVRFSV